MILARIRQHARDAPNRTAVIWNGQRVSYPQFSSLIGQARRHMLGVGQMPDGAYSILVVNHFLVAWAYLIALHSLGRTTVAAHTLADLQGLGLTPIAHVVTDMPERVRAAIRSVIGPDVPIVRVPPPAAASAVSAASAPAPDREHEGGHILLSSGTTGVRKKVLITHQALAAHAAASRDTYAISSATVYHIGNFLLSTAMGYRRPLAVWAGGGTAILHQGDADIAWQPFLDRIVTDAGFTPELLGRFLRSKPEASCRNDAMRLTIFGAATTWPMVLDVRSRLTEQVLSLLGATESGSIAMTAIRTPDDLTRHELVPGRPAELVDEADQPVAPGETGRLRVRPNRHVTGYLNDPETTRTFFRHGWFYTGDLARIGPDGRLELLGRANSVINLLGNKILPEVIEHGLASRLGLPAGGVCVFTTPPQVPGEAEVLHAAVEADAPLSTDVEAAIREALPFGPEVRLHVMPALPRNVMGKVMRHAVRDLVLAGGPASSSGGPAQSAAGPAGNPYGNT